MNWKSGLKEVGKGLINFGVAVLIFLVLQPFIHDSINIKYIILASIGYIISTALGFLFVSLGGNKDG